jgi:signal transduction histidine kinase
MRTSSADAETGQRGFLLTGRSDYLEPYERAVADGDVEFESFSELAGEKHEVPPAELERLAELRREKLAELHETIEFAKAGRRQEALAMVSSDRGRKLMEEFRKRIENILDVVGQQGAQKFIALQKTASAFRLINIAAAVSIVGFAVASILAVNRYVRELIAARDEVSALNRSLEQRIEARTAGLSRANEEIQRFASVVTHDLRSPLVNIMGFTSELERSLAGLAAPSPQADLDKAFSDDALAAARADISESIGFIRSSTSKMDGLINAILKLSREGQRKLAPELIDMRTLLEAAKQSLNRQIEAANAEVTISPSVPPLVSDRLGVEQIFGNLLDNAVKYLRSDEPGRISVRGYPAGGDAIFEVTDNGRGIPPRDLERVFEMFRRSGAQDRPGEGIGLAHVRATLRRLGGEITVASQPGQGTTSYRTDSGCGRLA